MAQYSEAELLEVESQAEVTLTRGRRSAVVAVASAALSALAITAIYHVQSHATVANLAAATSAVGDEDIAVVQKASEQPISAMEPADRLRQDYCSSPVYPPFEGKTKATWASPYVNSKEKLRFGSITCDWHESTSNYSWVAPELGPGRAQDHGADRGTGIWLDGPHYILSPDQREWRSHAFIAARVPSANHTSCCCQYMHGSKDWAHFTISEHCRAVVPGNVKSLEATCDPYLKMGCPKENATANEMPFPIPRYSEMYTACYI